MMFSATQRHDDGSCTVTRKRYRAGRVMSTEYVTTGADGQFISWTRNVDRLFIPPKRPRVAPAPVRVAKQVVRTDAAATMAVASIGESDAGDGAAGGDSGDESEGGDDDPPPPCRLKSKARLTRARLPGTNFNPIIIPGLLPRQATRQVYLSFDGGRHGCKRRREGGFSGR